MSSPHPNLLTPSEHIDAAQYHLVEAEHRVDSAPRSLRAQKEGLYIEASTHAAIAAVHMDLARWKAGR